MPRPTSSTTLQRPDLGQTIYEYMDAAPDRGFIGGLVLPDFPVPDQSAEIGRIPREELLKLPDTKRAARGAYNRGEYEFETLNYACKEYGWEEPVDDVEAKLYARYFDAEVVAGMRAADILLRNKEKRVADAVFNATTFTAHDVAVAWDQAATATPRTNIETGKNALRLACGILPNTLILPWNAFEALLITTEIMTYSQYTNPMLFDTRQAQADMLKRYFGIQNLIVSGAIYDSANEGQDASLADIWSDEYAMLCTIAGGRDLRAPRIGSTFRWTADSPDEVNTESYREEQTRATILRVRNYVDEKILDTSVCYLLGNVTTN